MQPLSTAPAETLRGIRFVLTDMDDTLTYRGRLDAAAYTALERLQTGGLTVIPITAAPAGWCDQMARMWPVDAVIGENGGVRFHRDTNGQVRRELWHDAARQQANERRLKRLAAFVRQNMPDAQPAADQPFRLTSLAFDLPAEPERRAALADLCIRSGASVTVNSLWLLAWYGGYNKLTAAQRLFRDLWQADLADLRDEVLYAGDSANDAPMFAYLPHSVGVSTVVEHLPDIPLPPAWVTCGPGGTGFVELADAILAAKSIGDPT